MNPREVASPKDKKAQDARLAQYAEEHFAQYQNEDPEVIETWQKIQENREAYEETGEVGTYAAAGREQRKKEIACEGFEQDRDLSGAKDFVHRTFGTRFLEKLLISKITYRDAVNVEVGEQKQNYFLPPWVYLEWERIMPDVRERKFRAESFPKWNTSKPTRAFIPTPILLYSFEGEHPMGLAFLAGAPAADRMRLFKLGTIAHEIAHHVFEYLMDEGKRAQWAAIVRGLPPLTDYARLYEQQPETYEFESFCEAVRLKTTAPSHLATQFPSADAFLAGSFPEIKASVTSSAGAGMPESRTSLPDLQ